MILNFVQKTIAKPFSRFVTILALMLCYSGMQASDYLVIKKVIISGNAWTRDYVIEKELDFQEGDTILLNDMMIRFEENRNRLLNTGLFNRVEINVREWNVENHVANIHIALVENWFWYPVPILELADRSFNEWIYQHDASLKRLNLGIRFMHINLSGNSDKLKLNFHTGFTRKYEIDYTFPYLNRGRTLGGYLNVLYVTHKEIPFETFGNQLHFTRDDNAPLLTRFRTSLGLKYRKNKSYYHVAYLEYHHKTVSDTIAQELNPYYFNKGENTIDHISLNYRFLYTNVDKKIYPTSGYRYLLDIRKDGFGFFPDLNHMHVATGWEQHFKLSRIFSTGFKVKGRKSITFGKDIPYAYQHGMGYYDDVLSGYQLYVIDGKDFAYLKTFQKIRLADLEFKFNRYMPLEQFKTMPLKIYLGVHGDIGYVHESQFASNNPFNKRLLLGAALSLDLIIYENYIMSCEFTINHTGEPGIFLQGTNTFE